MTPAGIVMSLMDRRIGETNNIVVLQGVELHNECIGAFGLHSPWLMVMAIRVGSSSLSDMPSVSMASSIDFAKAPRVYGLLG